VENNWHLTLRIEQPNVKQHITNYTGVGFEPGDRVTISAGGCVQTGGAGKTWKRYVDPQGPNSRSPLLRSRLDSRNYWRATEQERATACKATARGH
jgi:hypothetical protein